MTDDLTDTYVGPEDVPPASYEDLRAELGDAADKDLSDRLLAADAADETVSRLAGS